MIENMEGKAILESDTAVLNKIGLGFTRLHWVCKIMFPHISDR